MKDISTKNAPSAIGPYSQAVEVNGMIFTSGQIALLPNGELFNGNVKEQTNQVMQNLSAVLKEAGVTFNDVVKTTIYLSDMDDFVDVNEVYKSFLTPPYPARSTVAVKTLPKDVKVEIDCIAVKKNII